MCCASPVERPWRARPTAWSAGPWLGSRPGAVRYRARRSPTRRHGTDRRCATRSVPAGRRRGRSSRPYRQKHGSGAPARSGPSSSKNTLQRGVVAARSRPHQPAAVMVDDHDQIAVAALVGDLVDPDPAQPVNRSTVASTSALTRVTIDPTVRHATRNSSVTALFEVRTASHAARSSKSRVWPAP